MSPLRVVDLFAGAGGLSLGVERAGEKVGGAKVVLAVEASAKAARTYRANHPHTVMLEETIDRDWNVVERLEEHLDDPACDLLVGGPPCQGWSSLASRGDAARRDGLNACVGYFLAQVERLMPPAVVMENVRGLAVKDKGRHLRDLLAGLERLGYRAWSHDVRSADYGVPQLRHRVFVVAVQQDLEVEYELAATHQRPVDGQRLDLGQWLPGWLTVWDAIGDLPSIPAGGRARAYGAGPTTGFQQAMRGDCGELTWHEAPNHSEKIRRVLRALKEQGASRAPIEDAVGLTSGFHNTYCRLRSDEPATAVTSSVGRVSSGRYAHPFDDRALTPREAARLQTFPDDYRWKAERWHVYLQIGNAVPPVLAEAVLTPLLERLVPSLS